MTTLQLSLGTNLGYRAQNLQQALNGLNHFMTITAISPIYKTPPWGPIQNQPDYYNMCATAECDLQPLQLLDQIKELEQEIGRLAGERWGPRLIDIDLLFYGDTILETERLIIPHKQAAGRAFVLVPLHDIAPNVVHPINKQSVTQMLAQVDTNGIEQIDHITLHRPLTSKPATLFAWGERTHIMGILNATPDSFSGDGVIETTADFVARAVAQAEQFVADGADIIDIGGESTRPGGETVDGAKELARVLPVIKAVRQALPHTVISIDTYRPSTAEAALEAGANWINDIWGLQYDPRMAEVTANAGCPIIMMHNGRNRPRLDKDDGAGGYYGYFHYNDLLGEIGAELGQAAEQALTAGIAPQNIILDPGVGFGKTAPQNIELIGRMGQLKSLGYPLLLGASRKGFIGKYLGNLPAHQRVEGTAATTSVGIVQGADIIRVHDVKEMARVAKMTDLMVRPFQ